MARRVPRLRRPMHLGHGAMRRAGRKLALIFAALLVIGISCVSLLAAGFCRESFWIYSAEDICLITLSSYSDERRSFVRKCESERVAFGYYVNVISRPEVKTRLRGAEIEAAGYADQCGRPWRSH